MPLEMLPVLWTTKAGYDRVEFRLEKNTLNHRSRQLLPSDHDGKVPSIDEVKEYLKPSRSDNYEEWKYVIWAIASTDNDIENIDSKLLALADEFSKQSTKYKGITDVRKTRNHPLMKRRVLASVL